MAKYGITDDATGMLVEVETDNELTEQGVRSIIAQGRKNAAKSLTDGSYAVDKNTFQKRSKEDANAELRKMAAYSMGIKPDDVDIDSGMGMWNRTKLYLQPTDADQMKQLEDTYGKENVNMLDVGGTRKMFYRDPKTKKMTMVDEMGASLADFTADIAGTALPILGAVGAAALTGGASIPVMALAAATGGFVTSVGQDVAVRAASGEDIRGGEIATRRGIEHAIGIPIDLVTGVGGKFLTKSIGKRAADAGTQKLLTQLDDVMAKYDPEGSIKLTAAQESSTDASLKQSIRAGINPDGAEARAYALQRDEILKLNKAIRGEGTLDEPIEDVMQNVADRQMKLIDAYEQRIKKMDAQKLEAEALARKQSKDSIATQRKAMEAARNEELDAMRKQAEAGINKITKGKQRLESVNGDAIRKQQEAGYTKADTTNKNLYDRAYELTDTVNANTPVAVVKRVLDRIDDEALLPDSPELAAVKLLRKRLSDNPEDLTFRELDRFVRGVTDKINYKKKYGTTETEYQLQQIGAKLDKLVDDAIGAPKTLGGRGAGEPAKEAHRAARKHYKEKVLPYFDGDRAANLSRTVGGSSESVSGRGENVLARTFATRGAVRDAIESGVSRTTLKEAYIEQAVRAADGGKIKFDDNILEELYSNSKDSVTGRRIGAARIRSDIRRINEAIEKGKGKVNVTDAEVKAVLDETDPPAKAKALRAIAEKKATQEKLKKARQSALGKITRGEMPAPEDIHHFVDDIAGMRPTQIQNLMKRLPNDKARASLGRSGYDALLEKAGAKSAKAQRSGKSTGRESLWEPETMHDILNDSAQRKQWESLLGGGDPKRGKELVKDIEALNNWLLSSAEIRETTQESIGRFVTSTGASGTPNVLFVSPQLPRWIGRKVLGVIHTSPLTRTLMIRHLKEGTMDQEVFQRLFYTAMGTQRGLDAITDEMAKDPAFSAWMQESMNDQEGQ